MYVMIIAILVVLGLCFGSFVNALVYRLYMQDKKQIAGSGQRVVKKSDFSIVHGRSMCPHCKHELAAKDLIPVFSWLKLRGKCRYCLKKFDDTPIAEIVVPLLFILSYIYWIYPAFNFYSSVIFVLWLMIIVGFVALVLYDQRWYLLPNKIVFPLQAIGLFLAVLTISAFPETHSLLQLILGLLFSAGLFWMLHTVSGGKWIGYGDVKLAVVIGLVLGRGDLALLMLFMASAIGSIIAIPMLVSGKASRSTKLPFGPFLITATVITYLFGADIIGWYSSQFLLF